MVWRARPSPTAWIVRLALALFALGGRAAVDAAEVAPLPLRLRCEWGGGERRTWHGAITISEGELAGIRPMGLEPDEPGSMWIEAGRALVRQRSSRTYDAFDLALTAPESATVVIELRDVENAEVGARVEIALSDLLRDSHSTALDDTGNRLVVRRPVGDRLMLRFDRDSLVFAPNETFSLAVTPQFVEPPPDTALRLRAEIIPARGTSAVSTKEFELRAPATNRPTDEIPLEIALPAAEGAYQLAIAVTQRGLRERLVRVVPSRVLFERRVPLVVVAPTAAPAPVVSAADARALWTPVTEIDPATPAWWKRLVKLPQPARLPLWPQQGPLRNGDVAPWTQVLGTFTRLSTNPKSTEGSWEAFPLTIDRPGAPHMLEVEFPSDVRQDLGISIIEPDAAGAVGPIGLDSGVYVSSDSGSDKPRLLRHRLIFWPKTKTPLVLCRQRSVDQPAVFGKLRVLAGPDRLHRAAPRPTTTESRLVACYFDRPLFPENFSATAELDPWNQQSIDDWQTFFEGGTRLVDYLNHAGYNGLMMAVLADGSTIYPSEQLQPTPRFDTGMLRTDGEDPIRKDVLEMLFHLFDREQLALLPALQFSTPLPQLEAILRRGGEEAVGLEWVDGEGTTWLDKHAPQRGLAPYYNPLDDRVQEAMLAVVRELVGRYQGHPAFRGLAVQLAADGYAQLPGSQWGFDDRTIARFQRETRIRVPGAGPERFAQRAQFLLGESRPAWLRWRAGVMAAFYRRVRETLHEARPGATLYLAGSGMFDSPTAQWQLRPALPQAVRIEQVMLDVGIAPDLYQADPHVVLLRPRRISPPGALGSQAVDFQLNVHSELDRPSTVGRSGTLLFHPPHRQRLESFEAVSPFGAEKTHALLLAQSLPADERNRQRYAQSLGALDTSAIFDGGWLLPLGQEDALRSWLLTYRQLPADGFKTSPASQQPLIVRTRVSTTDSHVYVVNESPWPVRAALRLAAAPGCTVLELGSVGRSAKPLEAGTWNITLPPFGLVAARFSQPGVRVDKVELETGNAPRVELEARIRDLELRATALASQPPLTVLANPGFESPRSSGEAVAGWSLADSEGAEMRLDSTSRHEGLNSLRLAAARQMATLTSDFFPAPKTGRVALSVWLRTDNPQQQPAFRLAIEGPADGSEFYRFAQVGGRGARTVALKKDWTAYVFQVDDLPTQGMEQARVRFDLMEPGSISIDDVQLFHLSFNKSERIELSKILVSARGALEGGGTTDCLRFLDSYWPRFLEQNVAPVGETADRAPRIATRPTPTPVQAPDKGLNTSPDKPTEKPATGDKWKWLMPRFGQGATTK